MKKIISMILCIAMLLTCFSGLGGMIVSAKTFNVDTIIECESGKLKSDEVLTTKDKTASGGKYIVPNHGGEKIEDPRSVGDAGFASYEVNIPEDGNYRVYLRSHYPNMGADSFIYWWDSVKTYTHLAVAETDDWNWLMVCEKNLTAGKHTFALCPRESGMFWDCLYITTDASKVPVIDTHLGAKETSKPTSTPTPTKAPGSSADIKVKELAAKDGSVILDASDIVADKENVSLAAEAGAASKSVVTLTQDDRNIPSADVRGGLEANIMPDESGLYYIWMRMLITNTGNDSVWTYLDSGDEYTLTMLAVTGDEYKWQKVGLLKGVKAGEKVNFRLRARETGAKIDRILITNNATFIPEGEGRAPKKGEVVVNKLDESVYPKPSVTPPPSHPRLMFTKDDVGAIAQKVDALQNAKAKAEWEKLKNSTNYDGNLTASTGAGNYNSVVYNTIEAKAFDYAIFGNKENGEQAVSMIKNLLATVDNVGAFFHTRYNGHAIFLASEVYDWCYDLISADDKAWITAICEGLAGDMEMGYPPYGQGTVCGHGREAQLLRDLLSLGIATYDERPDIYNVCAGRIFAEYVEPSNYYYQSGSHHQGNGYGCYRWSYDLVAQYLIKAMSGQDLFDQDLLTSVAYYNLYLRRPDGAQAIMGDDYSAPGQSAGTYWSVNSGPLFWDAGLSGDPYVKRQYQLETPYMTPTSNGSEGLYTSVIHLIVNDPSLTGKPLEELPLTRYFGSPNGTMIARTGWDIGTDSSDAYALMKIGEQWGANHDHLDAGTFQLFYKGALASESGWYDLYGTEQDAGYNKRTIAHNALLVYDPDEPVTVGYNYKPNDGGQRWPNNGEEPASMDIWMNNGYDRAEVIGHEYGPDTQYPEYSYLAGDITKAYTSKVDEVLRSMLFINTNEKEHPAVMVVMDKVVSADKSFKKSWILHMQEEPKIEGNKTVVIREENDNNGRMVAETLLPKNPSITKIGGAGQEFMVDGRNYNPMSPVSKTKALEAGWGRVEVSPSSQDKEDYFLHVLTVSDADGAGAETDIPSTLIEGANYAGAAFDGNRVAVFAKDSREKIQSDFSFTIPGSGTQKVFVGGLKAGTWSINGSQTQIATEEGGCIYFDAEAGTVSLSYAGGQSNKLLTASSAPVSEGITVKVGANFICPDVAPTIVDDRTLIPLRAVTEAFGADVSYDGETATATIALYNSVLNITENATTAYLNGAPVELDVPAMVLNDRFVVPVRFVSENFGAKVEWDDHAQAVYITPPKKPVKVETPEGCAKIIASNSDEYSEQFYDTCSWDGDLETLWSAQGEHYITYTFDQEYMISDVEIVLNQNSQRNALFELLYSTDGENFTSVYDGHGDGTVGDNVWEKFSFTPVKAKYFKYIGKGSNISMWNGLKEIRFRIAK